jgi:hypothetical protein
MPQGNTLAFDTLRSLPQGIHELCKTLLFVIPAKAGIQEMLDNTGYTLKGIAPAFAGMTKMEIITSDLRKVKL